MRKAGLGDRLLLKVRDSFWLRSEVTKPGFVRFWGLCLPPSMPQPLPVTHTQGCHRKQCAFASRPGCVGSGLASGITVTLIS